MYDFKRAERCAALELLAEGEWEVAHLGIAVRELAEFPVGDLASPEWGLGQIV